jgi:hypothetical protein
MQSGPKKFADDLARVRLDNALALFEEFVRSTARHADAATLRGLEGRFAEKLQIQPSYWSQIKGGSRQIGERLARQFEQLCRKPNGWMDLAHGTGGVASTQTSAASPSRLPLAATATTVAQDELAPRDDDERFIMGLVLTFYRRHPQRARARLLDLLGEVLIPATPSATASPTAKPTTAAGKTNLSAPAEDPTLLWARTQAGVAPLKRKK